VEVTRARVGGSITKLTIALVLAVGLAAALNMIVFAVLYDAITQPDKSGLSENATQVLTGWGGGIIGILGAVFGYEAGTRSPPSDVDDRTTVDE
jgi:hypothetical protein